MRKFSWLVLVVLWLGCHGSRPVYLEKVRTDLPDCPASPNCVSSQAETDDKKHYIAPLSYEEASDWGSLVKIIESFPHTRIINQSETYLHAEYTSPAMGFRDDVTCLLDIQNKQIHLRSASRLGYGDFGANRRRLNKITELYLARDK